MITTTTPPLPTQIRSQPNEEQSSPPSYELRRTIIIPIVSLHEHSHEDRDNIDIIINSPPSLQMRRERRDGWYRENTISSDRVVRRRLDFDSVVDYLEPIESCYDRISYLLENNAINFGECTDNSSDCSICLNAISTTNPSDRGGTLPCGHAFHESCLKKWFATKHFTCPNCRTNLDVFSLLKE